MGLTDKIRGWLVGDRGKAQPDWDVPEELRNRKYLEDQVASAERSLAENRLKDAMKSSRNALKIGPDFLPAIRVHIKAAAGLRKYAGLVELCDKLLKEDESNPENWYLKGYVLAKRREPNLPLPERGYFFPSEVQSHPFHFTPEYKQDLRLAKECLYRAGKLDDEGRSKPENREKLFYVLNCEQLSQITDLTSHAFNVLYEDRAKAEAEVQRKFQAMEYNKYGGRYRDPDSH